MTQKTKVRTTQTIQTINRLLDAGIKRLSVIIRHSERFFSKNADMEPFMELTRTGKDLAVEFGRTLRENPSPKLFSSFMGRCIETAYLIEKGYSQKYGCWVDHNFIDKTLSPFYVKNVEKAIPQIEEQGNDLFIRNWFDNLIDENIMENPEKTSTILSEFMVEKIKGLEENQIAICVSHDWNIYPLKEFKLNLKHETSGNIGYLDGIIFFEKENRFYITHYQTDPVLL